MLRPMKLEGALKLYIFLYVIAFAITFLTSVPMLYHVASNSREQPCLLFSTPDPIKYGSPGGCIVSGILPLVTAVCAFFLGFFNLLHLRKTQDHIKLPEMTSDEFRLKFKRKFWRIIVCHGIVLGLVAVNAIIITTGYTTACDSLYLKTAKELRSRIQYNPTQNRGNQYQQQNQKYVSDYTNNRYVEKQTDVLGREERESSITCRRLFTDPTLHYQLKLNSFNTRELQTKYGFWSNDASAESRNYDLIATRDNLILEISLAGAWIGLFVWGIMLALMLKERHHLKAFLTDESMWGGSDYGGSVRSGRSRKSSKQERMMSPIDFENMDKMSHHSKMSYDRSSHISRASKSSKGTSYKDMSGARKGKANSYKNMNGRGSTVPSQLTVSRLENVPEVESDYTVNRLLNGNSRPQMPPQSNVAIVPPQNGNNHTYLAPDQNMDNFNDDRSVANQSIMTVTGAIIGPGTKYDQKQRTPGGAKAGGGLMDYFSGTAVSITPQQPGGTAELMTEESDIM